MWLAIEKLGCSNFKDCEFENSLFSADELQGFINISGYFLDAIWLLLLEFFCCCTLDKALLKLDALDIILSC